LYLDDLGTEKPTDWALQTLYLIIDRRYPEMMQTIISSNLNLDELSSRLGDRIASRIPINDTLARLFSNIRKKQGLTSEYVFVYQGKRIKDVKTAYNAALKRAGILDANFHTLRHTFASHFVMRGGSLKALQEILGHSNIKTTMRYAHLSQEHKKEAVELLDGLTTSNSMSFYVTNCEKSGLPQNPQPTAVT
jgi:integrase